MAAPRLEQAPVEGMYVGRRLTQASRDRLVFWLGKHVGVAPTQVDDNLHVTVVYSRAIFHWMPDHDHVRGVTGVQWKILGKDDAVVLVLNSEKLDERYDRAVQAGAVSDYADYVPHLTIYYAESIPQVSKWPLPDFELEFEGELMGPIGEGYDVFAGDTWTDGQMANGIEQPRAVIGKLVEAVQRHIAKFDESQPRHPAGSSKGGEFAPKGGGSGGSRLPTGEALVAANAAAKEKDDKYHESSRALAVKVDPDGGLYFKGWKDAVHYGGGGKATDGMPDISDMQGGIEPRVGGPIAHEFYFGRAGFTINTALRKGKGMVKGDRIDRVKPNKGKLFVDEVAALMDEEFEHSPYTAKPGQAFARAIGADFAGKLKPGDEFTDKAYTSTTTDSRWLVNNIRSGDTPMLTARVRVARKTKVMLYRQESEVLLPRNTRFTVDKIENGELYLTAHVEDRYAAD